MDSENSGSLQSSSGGDEEYGSRAESISAFLNPTGHVGPIPNPSQPPLVLPFHHHPTTTTPSMFDPLSNYFNNPISRPPPLQNPNPLLNMDLVWPNCTESNPILPSSSSVQPFFSPQSHGLYSTTSSSAPAPTPTVPFPTTVTESATATHRPSSSSATSDHTHVPRNPKKRSRASRRAPTTVLTTDTTNFKAMVQEFTGIPARPFTSSSPFPRNRFDLFGTPSSMRSNPMESPHSQPPYLLRPFAQKLQPLPPRAVSSSDLRPSSSFLSTNNNNTVPNSTSELGLFNMENIPNLNFQTFLQSPPKNPQANSAILGSKNQGSVEINPANDQRLKMVGLDDFGLSHGRVDPTDWSDGGGLNGGDQGQLRSVNGGYNYSRNAKGSENGSSRGEGMVETWICSSD